MKLSVLVEEYEKKIVQLKEEMEHTLRDPTFAWYERGMTKRISAKC
jgi:hypothetical protein